MLPSGSLLRVSEFVASAEPTSPMRGGRKEVLGLASVRSYTPPRQFPESNALAIANESPFRSYGGRKITIQGSDAQDDTFLAMAKLSLSPPPSGIQSSIQHTGQALGPWAGAGSSRQTRQPESGIGMRVGDWEESWSHAMAFGGDPDADVPYEKNPDTRHRVVKVNEPQPLSGRDGVLFEERPVVYQHLLRSLTVGLHSLSARYNRPYDIASERIRDALLSATEHMLKCDAIRSLTESQEYRMQLLDVWSRSGVPEHSIITEAILKDDAEISSLVHSVLLSAKKDELSRIVGKDAEKLMHVIQTVIHSNPPWLSEDSNSSREAHELLVQLYKAAELFPTELLITGVKGHHQHVISSGGFADVFQATFRGTGVALKRCRIFLNQSCDERRKVHRMIAKEASIWKELRHRHLLPFLGIDLETFPGFMCLVFPWMRNGALNDYLKSNPNIYIDKLLFEVAQGVEYLHSENVVHGDLRGTSILIDDERCARLADFGLASLTETATQSTNQRGSTRWMAPELLSPEQFDLRFQRTFATDVYAFACVILEVYSGRLPFADVVNDIEVARTVIRGNRPKRPSGQVRRPIPNNMWRLVTECWSQRNSQRPTMASVVMSMKRSHFAQTTY